MARRPDPAARKRRDLGRGCLAVAAAGWLAWILIDLGRLGVFSGRRTLADALFDMPSLGVPLLLAIGLAPVAFGAWRQARRRKAFPAEPWMWDRIWDRHGARPLEWRRLLQPLAVGLPVTVIAPMLVLVARFVVRSDFLLLALTPFYAFVLGFWGWWLFRLARVLRFRRPRFRFDRFPFFLGERVEGVLEGIDLLAGCPRVSATLRCVKEEWQGSGKGRHRARETLREETVEIGPAGWVRRLAGPAEVDRPAGATRLAIPLRFELPAEDLGTRLLAEPARRWELETRAERPGFDFQATFLLPVYPPPPGGGAGSAGAPARAGRGFTRP